MKNRIIAYHGTWLEIDVSTPKHPDAVMKIDAVDWWRIQSLNLGRIYAFRNRTDKSIYCRYNKDGRNAQVHRLICPDFKIIDHASGDGLDNRRENIRECTLSQNQMNTRRRVTNTSGTVGVVWDKAKAQWKAQIGLNGRCINIGRYNKIKDAIFARKEAEERYFGEYAHKENGAV